MSVKLKKSSNKDEKVKAVGFGVEDFIAIEGLEKSGFEGETKVVHKIHGEKLIAKKLAKASKAEIEEVESPNRAVKDIKKK